MTNARKQLKTVEVWRPGSPTTSGRPKDVLLQRIRLSEARYLVESLKLATWRGRSRDAITWLYPTKSLLMFVGLMRYQERAPMSGLDSRTFSTHGPNPWKGVRHARNESYTAVADELMNTVHWRDEATGRDPLEALFRSLIQYRRKNSAASEPEPERYHRFPINRAAA